MTLGTSNRRRGFAFAIALLATTAVVIPAMAATAPDDSVTYMSNPAHTGAQPHDALATPLHRQWSVELGGKVSFPVIADGQIYVTVQKPQGTGLTNAWLYAFDAQSGAIRWGPVALRSGYSPYATVTYDKVGGLGRVFAFSTDSPPGAFGVITAFDALTGTQLWQTAETYEGGFGMGVTVNGTLYANPGGWMQAIDEVTGDIKWTVLGEGSSITASEHGLYTSGYCGNIKDHSPETGAIIWATPSSCWGATGFPYDVISAGRLYSMAGSPHSALPGIYDAATGQWLGSFKADAPPVVDGQIGFFISGSVLSAQNLATGAALWTFTGDCDVYTMPVVTNGFVYVVTARGNLYALDEQSGAIAWSDNVGQRVVGLGSVFDYPNPSAASPMLAVGEGLLIVPAGTSLLAYGSGANGYTPHPGPTPQTGTQIVEQHAIPWPAGSTPPKPTEITTAPDGNFWFLEPVRNRVAVMTPAGAVTEYDIPTRNSQPTSITTGPDGAIWFTESYTYKIGRITATGAISEFPTPVDRGDIPVNAPAGPVDITTGPDGALWFTNTYGAEIDRMTTAGVTTVYHLPDPLADRPIRLTFGRDGNIWFTLAYDVGRMKPDGTGYVRYTVPPYLGLRQRPTEIIAGPDGNIWFTESGGADWTRGEASSAGSGIARITLAGVITDFQTPTPGSGPIGLLAGPDGNIWFAEYWNYFGAPSKIGRMTSDGAIQEFWVPDGPYRPRPWGMTVGHDGALWSTETEGGKIARFDISSPPCPAPSATASTNPARVPAPERIPGSPGPGSGSGVTRTGPPPPVPEVTPLPNPSPLVGREKFAPRPDPPPPGGTGKKAAQGIAGINTQQVAGEVLDRFAKALLRFW